MTRSRKLSIFFVIVASLVTSSSQGVARPKLDPEEVKRCSEECLEENKSAEESGSYLCNGVSGEKGLWVAHPCTFECLGVEPREEQDSKKCFCLLCTLTNGTEFCGDDGLSIDRADCEYEVCSDAPTARFRRNKCKPHHRRKREDSANGKFDFRDAVDDYFSRKGGKSSSTSKGAPPPPPPAKTPGPKVNLPGDAAKGHCKGEIMKSDKEKSAPELNSNPENPFFIYQYIKMAKGGNVAKRKCTDQVQTATNKPTPAAPKKSDEKDQKKGKKKKGDKKVKAPPPTESPPDSEASPQSETETETGDTPPATERASQTEDHTVETPPSENMELAENVD